MCISHISYAQVVQTPLQEMTSSIGTNRLAHAASVGTWAVVTGLFRGFTHFLQVNGMYP
jgi:hypothetical protein